MTILGTFPNANKNNLIPVADAASGLAVEPLGSTWTRVDFTFHAGDAAAPDVDIGDNLIIAAGLIPRAGVDSPYSFQVSLQVTANPTTDVLSAVTAQLANGNEVKLKNVGGALPAPLVTNASYFIRDLSGSTFKLALTRGGAAIDITTAGSGTNTISNCPLSVTWERGSPYTGLFGTVRERWQSFGIELTGKGRISVDAGYARPGPRYTILRSGAELRGYVDYVPTGGVPPRCIVVPAYEFTLPLRLALDISEGGTSFTTGSIRDIQLGGRLGQKTILSHANKLAWGVDSAHYHLRIYQVGVVNGAPLDYDS